MRPAELLRPGAYFVEPAYPADPLFSLRALPRTQSMRVPREIIFLNGAPGSGKVRAVGQKMRHAAAAAPRRDSAGLEIGLTLLAGGGVHAAKQQARRTRLTAACALCPVCLSGHQHAPHTEDARPGQLALPLLAAGAHVGQADWAGVGPNPTPTARSACAQEASARSKVEYYKSAAPSAPLRVGAPPS